MAKRVMTSRRFLAGLCFVFVSFALLPALAPAVAAEVADDPTGLNRTYREAFQQPPPEETTGEPLLAKTLGLILNWFMGLLGFIFLMIIIYGGIGWMTAGGSEERVEKAKHQINAAIAGLIVVFISYALAEAIVLALAAASGTG